eukprot:6480128-Amphidinium_carterae.1
MQHNCFKVGSFLQSPYLAEHSDNTRPSKQQKQPRKERSVSSNSFQSVFRHFAGGFKPRDYIGNPRTIL